jgi:hypothetical protein
MITGANQIVEIIIAIAIIKVNIFGFGGAAFNTYELL